MVSFYMIRLVSLLVEMRTERRSYGSGELINNQDYLCRSGTDNTCTLPRRPSTPARSLASKTLAAIMVVCLQKVQCRRIFRNTPVSLQLVA